jgi:transposase
MPPQSTKTRYSWCPPNSDGSGKRNINEDGTLAFPGSGRLKPDDEELRRLRRENERLRMGRDILKKAVAICSDRRR